MKHKLIYGLIIVLIAFSTTYCAAKAGAADTKANAATPVSSGTSEQAAAVGEGATTAQAVAVPYGRISAEQAWTLLQGSQEGDYEIIDVRTPEEYASGHVQSAKNMDFYAVDFRGQIKSLDRNKTYFLYCRSGNRSGQSFSLMQQLGFSKVYDFGAFGSWQSKGYPVAEGAR